MEEEKRESMILMREFQHNNNNNNAATSMLPEDDKNSLTMDMDNLVVRARNISDPLVGRGVNGYQNSTGFKPPVFGKLA